MPGPDHSLFDNSDENDNFQSSKTIIHSIEQLLKQHVDEIIKPLYTQITNIEFQNQQLTNIVANQSSQLEQMNKLWSDSSNQLNNMQQLFEQRLNNVNNLVSSSYYTPQASGMLIK